MARQLSKADRSEAEAEAFIRQTICQSCQIEGDEAEKQHFVFRGQVTYFCPIHNSFAFYRKYGNQYWRRNGEQEQN